MQCNVMLALYVSVYMQEMVEDDDDAMLKFPKS